MDLASFLNAKQIKDIARIISEAELLTSGEIRLHLEEKCKIETEVRALEVFYSLNMGNTKLKNAVLLYISYGDQKFAICGDEGIHKNVSNRFWKSLRNSLKRAFEKKDFLCAELQNKDTKLFHDFDEATWAEVLGSEILNVSNLEDEEICATIFWHLTMNSFEPNK